MNLGLFWGVLFVVAAASIIRLATIHFDPLHPPDLKKSVVGMAGELLNTVLVLWSLQRRWFRGF